MARQKKQAPAPEFDSRSDVQRCTHCRSVCDIESKYCQVCHSWTFEPVTERQCPVIRELWMLFDNRLRGYMHTADESGGLLVFLSRADAEEYLESDVDTYGETIKEYSPKKVYPQSEEE